MLPLAGLQKLLLVLPQRATATECRSLDCSTGAPGTQSNDDSATAPICGLALGSEEQVALVG